MKSQPVTIGTLLLRDPAPWNEECEFVSPWVAPQSNLGTLITDPRLVQTIVGSVTCQGRLTMCPDYRLCHPENLGLPCCAGRVRAPGIAPEGSAVKGRRQGVVDSYPQPIVPFFASPQCPPVGAMPRHPGTTERCPAPYVCRFTLCKL